jgi:hypothetical protein
MPIYYDSFFLRLSCSHGHLSRDCSRKEKMKFPKSKYGCEPNPRIVNLINFLSQDIVGDLDRHLGYGSAF